MTGPWELGALVWSQAEYKRAAKPLNPLIFEQGYISQIMAYLLSLVALSFAALAVLLLAKFSKIGQRPPGLPPGPPTIALLGNLHLVCLRGTNSLNIFLMDLDANKKAAFTVSKMG